MKILLAYDGLERSRGMLDEAAKMGAEIDRALLMTVVSSAGTATRGDGPAELGVGGGAWEAQPVEQALAAAQAFLRSHGVEAEVAVRHGDPVETIGAELAEGDYDLLIVGTRLGDWLDQMLLGNVSERLAESATCPVLVVGDRWKVRVERREPSAAEPGADIRLTTVGSLPA